MIDNLNRKIAGQVAGGIQHAAQVAAAAAAGPQAAGVAALNVNIVNLPVGTTPQETVSAVRRFARTGGDTGGADLDRAVAIR
jgi:hypothetical protein